MKEQPQCGVDASGNKRWCLGRNYHREDGPAIEWEDGDKEWWLHGKRHREDGPAVERASGAKEWWLHGYRHREDGPAVEYRCGSKDWYLNGEEAHPETLVDLHLSRGTFCWWSEKENKLEF